MMKWIALWGCSMIWLTLFGCSATPKSGKTSGKSGGELVLEEVLDGKEGVSSGGSHWRLETPNGAIHVWRPKAYQHSVAGTVVYVHGYFTNVDGAWQDYHLRDQFSDSRRNAIFIVPEAPSGNNERVFWEDLENLLQVVWEQTKLSPPPGTLAAVGHSGAFRTISSWVKHPRLAEIVLLDGFYSEESKFAAWLEPGAYKKRRLILIGSQTAGRSLQFIQKYPFAVIREGFPDGYNPEFSTQEKEARLLFVLSQYSHMGLVTDGLVVPQVLEITSLSELPRPKERFPWEKSQ